tara:strand:+ start:411 stop:794 length:384 start_codon:yes stop_codon:yes gene_type:complete
MNPHVTYSDIDEILKPWASERNLHIYTECKDEEVRVISVLDEHRDEYHLFVHPDYERIEKKVAVGCALLKRHTKKHTFYRERKNFDYRESIILSDLEAALNRSLKQIEKWGDEQGGGINSVTLRSTT